MRTQQERREQNTEVTARTLRDSTESVAMWIIVALFALSLLPILYVGLYTHPTGDDFWYGQLVMKAWREQHSVFACLGAAFTTIKEFYYTWQGTWYSIFLFCFNPEMLFEGGYKLVPLIAIALLGGGVYLLLYQSMHKTLKLSKEVTVVSFCVIMFQILQYMPRTTSGIYWFNGIMHYNANTFHAMVAVSMMIVFLREGRKFAYVFVLLSMILLGGGNYQAALIPLLFWGILVGGTFFYVKKDATIIERLQNVFGAKRVWLLGIGVLLEMPGLLISGLAPGNSLRSEDFEISLKWTLQSIYYSIDRGIYLVRDDFYDKYPAMLIMILMLVILLWYNMWKVQETSSFRFPVPLLFIAYSCGMYWAMYTPGIFSKSDVSGGVANTVQQMFLLTSLANVVYAIGYIQRFLKEHVSDNTLRKAWWGPGSMEQMSLSKKTKDIFAVVSICGFILAGILGYSQSTDKLCVDLVQSGRAKVYDMVREEQMRILNDSAIRDAYIPELFGYDYYPICHIQASGNPDERLNRDMQVYFGKESVVAYDFRKWLEEEDKLGFLDE